MRTQRSGEAAILLLDAIAILVADGIGYAVIGAMAAAVHGVVRASLDADALVSLAIPRVRDLERRFKDAKFNTELRYGDADDPIGALLALTDQFGNRVDLLVGLRGLEIEAIGRAIDVPYRGQILKIVSREDLIDAHNVLAVSGGLLDMVFLRRLAARFGKATAAALESLLTTIPGA